MVIFTLICVSSNVIYNLMYNRLFNKEICEQLYFMNQLATNRRNDFYNLTANSLRKINGRLKIQSYSSRP